MLPELLAALIQKNIQVVAFGWGSRGAGGSYNLVMNFMPYQTHRPGSSGIQAFPFDTEIVYGNDMPLDCAREDVFRYLQENILAPAWFFDWAKQYLAVLRANQPAFDAPVEEKLVWVTHVAWCVNAALGATNLHGSILPSALYEHVTGNDFISYAGDGSYMFTAQHAAAFPSYWKDAWNEAAQRTLVKAKGDVLLDSGFKVFDRKFVPRWESAWHGSVFPAPFETARYRYDPPIQIGVDCEKISGRCNDAVRGMAGAHYNNTISNDPYVVRASNGNFADDKGLTHVRYMAWAFLTPWIVSFPAGYASTVPTHDPSGVSMLGHALAMAQNFTQGLSLGVGDESFWKRLEEWRRPEQQMPDLVQTSARVDANISLSSSSSIKIIPLYTPNHELSFRYYYPAMIDLVLACDYYELVQTGINTWWKYNIGSGVGGVGTCRATEDTPSIDGRTGKRLRDKNGVPYAAPVSPPGAVQDAYDVYREAKEKSSGLNFITNYVKSLIAIVQAVYGNYGGLVDAGKSWYDTYSKTFPEPEDNWRGVVPPSPLVQRRLPTFAFISARMGNSDAKMISVPDVGGPINRTGSTHGYGGVALVPMLASVRAVAWIMARFGAPFVQTAEDRIDLEGIQNPVLTVKPGAPKSITFGTFPPPGFVPGSVDAIANSPSVPQRSKAGLWILGFGVAAAIGGLFVTRRLSVPSRVKRLVQHG
jgi:hypothetical protein